MNPILIAVVTAVVMLVPGYLVGRLVRDRPTLYKVVFYGSLGLMVVVLTWALVAKQSQVVGLALGFGFGMVNGARHGYKPVFAPLLNRDDSETQDV